MTELTRDGLIEGASQTMAELDQNQRAQACLAAFKALGEEQQTILMNALDAFTQGYELGRATALRANSAQ